MDGESAIIPVTEAAATPRAPMHVRYLRLIRTNANFRRLWLAQLVSEIGDWFYSLAIYDLLLETTHSGKAVSYAIIIQTLPWFFMTPLAGHLVDRFSRRLLMILADIARGFVVLGLLRALSISDVGPVYALLGLEVIFSSFFEPARNAILPNLVAAEETLPANALSSATWSFALASGAALGGIVTALLGRQVAFVVNSISFFASALLIQDIKIVEPHLEWPAGAPAPASANRVPGAGDELRVNSLGEGQQYLRQNPQVLVLILAKTGLGLLSGALLLLAIFGERVFPVAGHGALAMGAALLGAWSRRRHRPAAGRSLHQRTRGANVEGHQRRVLCHWCFLRGFEPRAQYRACGAVCPVRARGRQQRLGHVDHALAAQRARPVSRPRLCRRHRLADAHGLGLELRDWRGTRHLEIHRAPARRRLGMHVDGAGAAVVASAGEVGPAKSEIRN